MSTSYKWAHPKGLNSFRGQIGEVLARKFLEKEGFRVISYEFLVAYNPSWDFWGSMKGNFVEWNEALNKIYAGSVHRSRRFDFVARKGEKYYVVEVKTNRGQLSKWQKEGFQLSKRFGFIPMVVRTKVKLIADCKDVSIEVL
jgi:hypothetical protein